MIVGLPVEISVRVNIATSKGGCNEADRQLHLMITRVIPNAIAQVGKVEKPLEIMDKVLVKLKDMIE